MISSQSIPLATNSSTSLTRIRVPRNVGLPWQTLGFLVTYGLAIIFFITANPRTAFPIVYRRRRRLGSETVNCRQTGALRFEDSASRLDGESQAFIFAISTLAVSG